MRYQGRADIELIITQININYDKCQNLRKMSYGKEKLEVGEEVGQENGSINFSEEKEVELLFTMAPVVTVVDCVIRLLSDDCLVPHCDYSLLGHVSQS